MITKLSLCFYYRQKLFVFPPSPYERSEVKSFTGFKKAGYREPYDHTNECNLVGFFLKIKTEQSHFDSIMEMMMLSWLCKNQEKGLNWVSYLQIRPQAFVRVNLAFWHYFPLYFFFFSIVAQAPHFLNLPAWCAFLFQWGMFPMWTSHFRRTEGAVLVSFCVLENNKRSRWIIYASDIYKY